ncbi:hypothetical protein KTD55_26055 [Burkholderia gladioli]|uniref:hypothetical protein n=1 Tax=Burkholderia gladioli TaxID=28095 RepID=UPI001C2155F7|nr:hypothetical protein [Burkholderia gladioli]MBU9217534.1 hypothetical protein [Burkholderia gladioli]MDN7727747.1 hypothetical protein [Burkholderia gladioli]
MNVTDLTQAIQGGLIQQDRLVKTDIPSLPANTMVPCRVLTASELGRDLVVPPFLTAVRSRGYGAISNFCFGGTPPMAVFGRS